MKIILEKDFTYRLGRVNMQTTEGVTLMEHTIDYARLGIRISELRRKRRLSQSQLAELADVTDSYISHIETGRKKASLESLVRIAAALDVTLDRILLGNQQNDLKNYLPELELLMTDCSPFERAVIYDMVKSVRESLTKNKGLISQSDHQ